MSESIDRHEPTPEFSAFLARDVARTLRFETRFAPSPQAIRARRLRVIMASAVGTVAALAVGLVFGTSTGYASARGEGDRERTESSATTVGVTVQIAALRLDLARARSELARLAAEGGETARSSIKAAENELRSMEVSAARIELDLTRGPESNGARPRVIAHTNPVTRALTATLNALAPTELPVQVPQVVPTLTLPPASARTTEALRVIGGVRQVAGGRLLVSDGIGSQIRLFDSTLSSSRVTLDGAQAQWRVRSVPLAAYLGDSTLLADPASRTVRVLDGAGRIARTVALPDMQLDLASPSYTDDRGRVFFSTRSAPASFSDSVEIVRVDLASGRVDTVGRLRNRGELGATYRLALKDAKVPPTWAARPGYASVWLHGSATALVPTRDDWAVLSDGSLAVVRGHDYHIDLLRSDGTTISSAKLPFDWQRLADETRRQLSADSTRRWLTYSYEHAYRRPGADTMRWLPTPSFTLDNKGFDAAYLTLHGGSGSVMPDRDGNLWILPAFPTDSLQDGVVYDVVNNRGELFQRVRIPADRSIAGFGKGGVVYLVGSEGSGNSFIERTQVPTNPR